MATRVSPQTRRAHRPKRGRRRGRAPATWGYSY